MILIVSKKSGVVNTALLLLSINKKMTSDFLYQYPALFPGILRKRYKRFFADIELSSGEIITAHCPNTGPMTGVCQVGNPVQVSKSDNPKRKLAYTWEMIQLNDTWVGINTALPNQVIKLALEKGLFSDLLGNYSKIRPEVPYGIDKKSRIDFLLTGDESQPPIYIEVKNTTWTRQDVALFPDTVTTRGQKHLRELMALLPHAQPVMLYFINRGDCPYFAPGDSADPIYGKLFREAIAQGVQVLPCRFEVTLQGINYIGLANLL
jgi:sugar fermentation stimulation protein A